MSYPEKDYAESRHNVQPQPGAKDLFSDSVAYIDLTYVEIASEQTMFVWSNNMRGNKYTMPCWGRTESYWKSVYNAYMPGYL